MPGKQVYTVKLVTLRPPASVVEKATYGGQRHSLDPEGIDNRRGFACYIEMYVQLRKPPFG